MWTFLVIDMTLLCSQNLDNWKSSRRKRQEHIIERVVEVKKLELEEHDRQRRRNKTFSEMMEERGNRGRKLSISLAVYNEEDANDLSDLGIGTSSGKSSVSGDTHDDTHSVLVSISVWIDTTFCTSSLSLENKICTAKSIIGSMYKWKGLVNSFVYIFID